MPDFPPYIREIDPDAEAARLAEERKQLTEQREQSPEVREQRCVLQGGHCYERTGSVLTSRPPQYVEQCKHCGKSRVAIPREPFEYRDA